MSSVHAVFYAGPMAGPPVAVAGPRVSLTPRGIVALVRWLIVALREFYRDSSARLALAVTAVIACYGGGALMFWYHAVALGEGGPNISWQAHWLLDSTFAFIGLTPALVLIIPFASWAANRLAGPDHSRIPWLYVALSGGLFALVTVPGPVAHDMFVGRGTWLANRVTELIGNPNAPLTPAQDYPVVVEFAQQFGFAVPTYFVVMAIALLLVRNVVSRRNRAVAVGERAVDLGRRGREMMRQG